jgi:hypothetical protein
MFTEGSHLDFMHGMWHIRKREFSFFLHICIRKHSPLIDAERGKPPFCLIIGYGHGGGGRYQTGRPCGSACKYDTNNCFSNSEVQSTSDVFESDVRQESSQLNPEHTNLYDREVL